MGIGFRQVWDLVAVGGLAALFIFGGLVLQILSFLDKL